MNYQSLTRARIFIFLEVRFWYSLFCLRRILRYKRLSGISVCLESIFLKKKSIKNQE